MTMTKVKTKYLIAITVLILSLSACSSLPFMGSETIQEKAFFDTKNNDKRSELEDEIKDFKSMKASLSRLVSLESDLSFLLDEMSRFNEKNPIMFNASDETPSNTNNSDLDVVYSPDGKKEYTAENTVDGWAESLGKMEEKWNTQAAEIDNLRIRGVKDSKTPTANERRSEINVDNSKFLAQTGIEASPAKPVMKINTTIQDNQEQKITNKFVDITGPLQLVGVVNDCKDWKVDSTKTYALHLASYKSRKAAIVGWEILNSKYANVWCETEAKVANVVVNGTAYLSLRVGGYDSKEKAVKLCSIVKQRGDYCAISSVAGERL